MRKTMLSALVIGASVFTVSAFAQANLGGAARVDAGVHAGAAAPGVMHAADQATTRTEQTLQRGSSHVKHQTRKAADKTRSTVDDNASANTNAKANGAIGADAGDSHADAHANVNAGAGLDTAATAGKAAEMGQGVGGEVRDAAHSAIQSTDRAAGSVGDAVKDVNASGNGNANTHGH
ncbi:hypothetical protein [Rhodanobacter thiooxydans]|uniref:hypothetical protein n=1 Tax=Rhodanobacter thiooxydans TaxID=416169 RepID=UPI000260DEAF|nr:hypothetical protein [Rhodanobacter thiooxydans]EIL96594.1 hypothetical protein UUA_17652 [Rhodanobacter thiooxydans LCS2]MCW0201778.1 hypothetical protein [Rhodanobacter thiooxydans]